MGIYYDAVTWRGRVAVALAREAALPYCGSWGARADRSVAAAARAVRRRGVGRVAVARWIAGVAIREAVIGGAGRVMAIGSCVAWIGIDPTRRDPRVRRWRANARRVGRAGFPRWRVAVDRAIGGARIGSIVFEAVAALARWIETHADPVTRDRWSGIVTRDRRRFGSRGARALARIGYRIAWGAVAWRGVAYSAMGAARDWDRGDAIRWRVSSAYDRHADRAWRVALAREWIGIVD